MSVLTDRMGIAGDRARKIVQDVLDLQNQCGKPIHDIGEELLVLEKTYSGSELVFAAYTYGREVERKLSVCSVMGITLGTIEVKKP